MRAEHTARRIATDQSGLVLVDHFASSARKSEPGGSLRPAPWLCQITQPSLAMLRGLSTPRFGDGGTAVWTKRRVRLASEDPSLGGGGRRSGSQYAPSSAAHLG